MKVTSSDYGVILVRDVVQADAWNSVGRAMEDEDMLKEMIYNKNRMPMRKVWQRKKRMISSTSRKS